MIDTRDLDALKRCIGLAREALQAGDAPFGSVLTTADGNVVREERNRIVTGENGDFKADATLHPELLLARWAQLNLTSEQRANSTVYTSGEHCAMCSAAHAYVGLGRIVYASSTVQLVNWMNEMGVKQPGVNPLPINAVAPHITCEGPVMGLDDEIRDLHRRRVRGADVGR